MLCNTCGIRKASPRSCGLCDYCYRENEKIIARAEEGLARNIRAMHEFYTEER